MGERPLPPTDAESSTGFAGGPGNTSPGLDDSAGDSSGQPPSSRASETRTILANRSPASPSGDVTLADLAAVVDSQAGP